MKPLSPRDRLVVWGFAVVALLVLFYLYVYTPKTREISVVSQQLKAANADLARLQAQAARKEELDRRVQQIQHDLQDIEAKLPSAREIPVLLVRLESLASQVSANLTLIKAAAESAAAGGPAAPTQPSGRAAGADRGDDLLSDLFPGAQRGRPVRRDLELRTRD